MDPNQTLTDIRSLVKTILDDDEDDSYATDLAEKIEGLDKWITCGGFLPGEWEEV